MNIEHIVFVIFFMHLLPLFF